MPFMVVTLDVSTLSGWLYADATCRVKRRVYHAGRGAGWEAGGRCGNGGACSVQGKVPTGGVVAQGTRGAHVEHAVHGHDLGRVEAERLVELRRALPSRKAGMRCGKRCGPGGMRALGVAATQSACAGRARLKAVGAQGTRGAHGEHALHAWPAPHSL